MKVKGSLDFVINKDFNHNSLIFTSTKYMTFVPDNSVIGSPVIQANDKDSGSNAKVTYSLISGHTHYFSLNSINNTIITMEIFYFEQQQSFELTVKAFNLDNPLLYDIVRCH